MICKCGKVWTFGNYLTTTKTVCKEPQNDTECYTESDTLYIKFFTRTGLYDLCGRTNNQKHCRLYQCGY